MLTCYAAINLILFLMEDFCVSNWSACCHSCNIRCKVCCAKCNGKEFDEVDYECAGFVLSDDILMEVDFDKLYNMYVKAKKDVQKYKMQLSHNVYTEEDHKYYIKKYLQILDRNI